MHQQIAQGFGLSRREPIFFYGGIQLDSTFSARLNFGKLGCQSTDKVFEPTGQIQIGIAHALNGSIKGCPVAVIVFTQTVQAESSREALPLPSMMG